MRSLIALVAIAVAGNMIHAGEVLLGGTNHVIGQGLEPEGLNFGPASVAFDQNGEIDLRPYLLESRLGEVENFEIHVADPHLLGWTWLRVEYHDGNDWAGLVSFVFDDQADDPYMSHAEWPDDNGYDDGWTAWDSGTYGLAVDRADLNGDGIGDGWKVYQVDANKKWNLVQTYSWDSLPDANGPGNVHLTGDARIRFAALGKWDSTEDLQTLAVRGGATVPSIRFGPARSTNEVVLAGSNHVVGQGVEPGGLAFGLESVSFLENDEIDLSSHALEGTLGDIENFKLLVAAPHLAGWIWFRMSFHDGFDWVPLVSFVLDDQIDDPYMTHAEWPDDNGYDDGWTAWGNGSLGMSVDRADTDGDGSPDAWKVHQADDQMNWTLVQTYSWNALPDANGPGNVNLTKDTRVRFHALGKWDASEAIETFSVRGGSSLSTVRFGPLQTGSGSLIRNVRSTTSSADQYVVTHYTAGIAMHPTAGQRTIAGLPAYLEGAEGIKTAQGDRGVTGPLVSFSLTAPANVYVGWDARCTTATWLASEGWSLVPETIAIAGDPDAPTRQVWRKSFPAGLVELAGPECGDKNNLFVMAVPAVEAPRITTISLSGGNINVTWTGGGTLYSSAGLSPAGWTSTDDSDGSYTAPIGSGNLFFRVQK